MTASPAAILLPVTMSLGQGEPPAGPWRVESVAGLVRLLLDAAGEPPDRPRIVAVDGRSAGGKTTLAELLHRAAPSSAVVHIDDLSWNSCFFGWADLLAHWVLEPLHRGQTVRYRPPAWQEHSREGAIEVSAGLDLVLVEGVGAARSELMHLIDAVVWVQSDETEAERRGIARDGGDAAAAGFWHEWMAEELPFLAAQRPWERATVVVDGTPRLSHDRATHMVLAEPVS